MMKSLVSLSLAFTLTACSLGQKQPEAPFPAEFLGADYLLSEADAKSWANASQQAEQCIYPTLTRIQQQHFAKEDAYIHAQYVFFYPLEKIIGEQYVKMLQGDERSMAYAQRQFKLFKTDSVKSLDKTECQRLRENARNDLAVLKGQYQSGMVDESKTAPQKDPDGAATNENKFFFDIIKWGAALLL